MDLLEFAITAAEKRGANQAEAYFSESNQLRVLYEKSQLKIGERKRDSGVGIRVALKNDSGFSTGFFYTNELTRKAVDEAIRNALDIAKARKADPDFKSFQERKKLKNVEKIYDKRIHGLDPQQVIDLVKNQIEVALQHRNIETTSGFTMVGEYQTYITNSLGIYGGFKTTNFYSYCFALAKDEGSLGSGWDEYANCFYDEERALESSGNAAQLAVEQLNPIRMKGGKMCLIIPPSALMQLMINLIVQMLRADKVQKQQSALAGKIGQQIGSEVLTMVDDGQAPCAVGSKIFDDEGCPTQRTMIMEKGVLKSYLHNTYTAHKDDIKSTGNSHRALTFNPVPKYTLEPQVGPTNIILKPGTSNKESLIAEVKNGLIMNGFIGAHTANIASGDFSMALDCPFKIEKGEKSHPIKEVMISGNIFDLLKNVEAVGNDVKQFEFNLMGAMIKDSSLISPSILVRDVSVSA